MFERAGSRGKPIVHASAAHMLERLFDASRVSSSETNQLLTGLTPLDNVLEGGLSLGDLCIIGGAPGVGKTIISLQMARNMAIGGHRVPYCCYEHDVPTLLGRLVALEVGALETSVPVTEDAEVRASIKAIMMGHGANPAAAAVHPAVTSAIAKVAEYGHNLELAQLSTAKAGLDVIHQHLVDTDVPFQAVFVDYLQKVGVSGLSAGAERWGVAVEELKDIALTENCLVVAISAVDEEALKAKRSSLTGLRGADAIAHEADVAIVLNDKIRIVSKAHLAYDTTRFAEMNELIVCTIEKNRRGRAPYDIEFKKDFARFRVDPNGGFVNERLIDDILVTE